jgi:hypothetical protein
MRHLKDQGYNQTDFQLYLNNKSIMSDSIYWCLDEPMFRDDVVCLQMFGDMTRQVSDQCHPNPQLSYRIDLSRAEEAKDMLDKGDLMVMAQKNLDDYGPMIKQHQRDYIPRRSAPDQPQVVWAYGGTVEPPGPPETNRAFCVKTYFRGCDGVVPWLTVCGDEGWDDTAKATYGVFYPALKKWGYNGCYGSLRLKAFRDGQQDAEYLTMLARETGATRQELEKALEPYAGFDGVVTRANDLDAGRVSFTNATPEKLEAMRRVMGHNLDQMGK